MKSSIPIISISSSSNQIDVFLEDQSSNSDFVDVLATFYPYNLETDADNFKILPYEEYVNEVSNKKRSAYRAILPFFDKLFGIVLAFLLSFIFFLIDPELLISVEAVVSLLGLYLVGKELWVDLDDLLISVTRSWKLKWRSQEYYYKRNYFGTIQGFWQFARDTRNQSSFLLADVFDFISQSNSKTVELRFDNKKLHKKTKVLSFESQNQNGLLGFKVSVGKRVLPGVTQRTEYFQSIQNNEIGTVINGVWEKDQVLVKHTYLIGRLKYYVKIEKHKIKIIER